MQENCFLMWHLQYWLKFWVCNRANCGDLHHYHLSVRWTLKEMSQWSFECLNFISCFKRFKVSLIDFSCVFWFDTWFFIIKWCFLSVNKRLFYFWFIVSSQLLKFLTCTRLKKLKAGDHLCFWVIVSSSFSVMFKLPFSSEQCLIQSTLSPLNLLMEVLSILDSLNFTSVNLCC